MGVSGRGVVAAMVCLLAVGPAVRAAAPIPSDRRIPASIAGTLSMSADQAMHMPTDVAIAPSGQIYVADGANDRVIRFDADGKQPVILRELAGKPLSRPVGVSTDARDRLWVADSGNHRVVVLRPDSSAESIELADVPGRDKPAKPTDVVVTADGRRAYIVDNDNHCVLIRDNSTGELKPMGRFGEGLGQFRWPFMVAIDRDGYVLITEAIGARVQRLSPRDQWAGQIGRWGVELGQLYRPKGVAIDVAARTYVGDSTLNVVQVYGPRGGVEGVLAAADGTPLRFQHPMGMCFDARGRLYVVELSADRVAIVAVATPTTAPAGGAAAKGDQP